MKKTFISILILFSTFHLFAQIEKGYFLVTGFGNYGKYKYSQKNIYEATAQEKVVTTLRSGGSIGYFFSEKLIAGAGLEYNLEKDGPYFFPGESLYGINNKFSKLLPFVYMGYYLPIVSKLYFNTNFKLMAGQYAEYPIVSIENNWINGLFQTHAITGRTAHLEARITPELSYFFSKHVGVYLGLGGLSYTLQDWNTDQSGWLISLQPDYWNVGIKVGR